MQSSLGEQLARVTALTGAQRQRPSGLQNFHRLAEALEALAKLGS